MKINLVAGISLAICACVYTADAQTPPPAGTQQAAPNQNTPPVRRQRPVEVADPNAPPTKYD